MNKTKRGFGSRIYRCRCKSGIMGWRTRLHNNYSCKTEWIIHADTWGLHMRLGFSSPAAAWKANPVIEGSTNSGDFRVAKT